MFHVEPSTSHFVLFQYFQWLFFNFVNLTTKSGHASWWIEVMFHVEQCSVVVVAPC